MNYIRHMKAFTKKCEEDERLTPYHISLYISLFQLWNRNRFKNPFPVVREELMGMSRIKSAHTYARCIRQLNEWEYISYNPNGNQHSGWQVACVRFDTGSGAGNDTSNNTSKNIGNSAGNNTSDNTGDDTVYKTYINNKNSSKRSPQNFGNNEEKNRKRNNQLHVSNDKDYSEPL